MTDDDDPATKRDLRELEARFEAKLVTKDELAAAVAKLATKDELAAAVAELATKDELAAAVAKLATKQEMNAGFARLERQIGEGMMHVANVVIESVRSQIAALDDKYKHIPASVTDQRSDFEAHVRDPQAHRPQPRRRSR